MSIPRSKFGPILVLVLAACSSGSESIGPLPARSAPTSTALNTGEGIVVQAMGAGSVDLTAANGGYADFQFVAQRKADGTVLGHFRQSRLRNGLLVEFEGSVTCVTIDPAFPGRARIGGVISGSASHGRSQS